MFVIKTQKKKAFLALLLTFALVITGAFAFLTSRDSKDNVFTMGKVKIELCEDDWYNEDGSLKSDSKIVNSTLSELRTSLTADGYTVTESQTGNKDIITAVKGDETLIYTDDGTNVYESNGINDFAENILPNMVLGKAPYIKNVGNNNTYGYINISIPVVEAYEEGSTTLKNMEIFVTLDEDGNQGVNDGWKVIIENKDVNVNGLNCNTYIYAYENEIEPGEQTPPLFSDVKIANFSNVYSPIIEYTPYIYGDTDSEETTTKQATLSISPFITASAADVSDGTPDPSECIKVNWDDASLTNEYPIKHIEEEGETYDEANMFRCVGLFSAGFTVEKPSDLQYCKAYIQGDDEWASDPGDEYTGYGLNGSALYSTIYTDACLSKLFNTMQIANEMYIFSLDTEQDTDDVILSAEINSQSASYYYEFNKHKADILKSFGLSSTDSMAMDISYLGYKTSVCDGKEEEFYKYFEEALNNYKTQLSSSSSFYSIFSAMDSSRDKYTITELADMFIQTLNATEANNLDTPMFYNFRQNYTSIYDGKTYSGAYFAYFSNDDGDTYDPVGVITRVIVGQNPIIIYGQKTGETSSLGDIENITSLDMNASGYGIQTTVAETPKEAYFLGVEEQDWENKIVTLNFYDPVGDKIEQQVSSTLGSEITIPEVEEGCFWYDAEKAERLTSGSKYMLTSEEPTAIIKGYEDASVYLTYAVSSSSSKTAYLVSCSSSAIGDIVVPETTTINNETYTVTSISTSVNLTTFDECNYITSITFPKTLTTISGMSTHYVIDGCDKLKTISFNGSSVPFTSASYIVNNCNALTSFTLPASSASSCTTSILASNCSSLETVEINNINYTNTILFSNLENLKTVYLNKPVQTYKAGKTYTYSKVNSTESTGHMFSNCPNLTDLYIKNGAYYEIYSKKTSYYDENGYTQYSYSDKCPFKNVYFETPSSSTVPTLVKNYELNVSDTFTNTNIYYGSGENGWSLLDGTVTLTSETNGGLPGYQNINKVAISSNVTSAGSFNGCSNVTSVEIGTTVDGYGYFKDCGNINNNTVTFTGSKAYSRYAIDYEVKTLTIPSTVESVEAGMLYGIVAQNIVFDEGVKSISSGIFKDPVFQTNENSYTQTITVAASVSSIASAAFEKCTALQQVTFRKGSQLKTLSSSLFYFCENLTSIIFPDNLETIESSVFYGCDNLSLLVIPSTVKTIEGTLGRMDNGITLYIPDSVTTISNSNILYWYGSDSNKPTVYVMFSEGEMPSGWNTNCLSYSGNSYNIVYDWYGNISDECDGVKYYYKDEAKTILQKVITDKTEVELPSDITKNLTKISGNAFSKCSINSLSGMVSTIELESNSFNNVFNVIWPDVDEATAKNNNYYGATTINAYTDDYAIYDNISKQTLIKVIKLMENNSFAVPNSVTAINIDAFSSVKSTLETLVLNDGGYTIESPMFSDFTALKEVTIGNNIIGSGAFSGCTALTTVNFGTNSTIGERAFEGCTNLNSVTLLSQVQTIGAHAFDGAGVTELTMPTSVSSIGEYAFANCANLTKYTHSGNGSTCTYGDYVFYNCTSLKELNFEDGTLIALASPHLVSGATSITKLTLGNGVDGTYLVRQKSSLGTYSIFASLKLEELNYNIPTIADYYDTNNRSSYAPNTSYLPFGYADTAVINIGNNVTELPRYFAYNASGSSCVTTASEYFTVNISENNTVLNKIRSYAFYGVKINKEFSIPSTVTTIGDYAFAYSLLSNVVDLSNVTVINNGAFYSCGAWNSSDYIYIKLNSSTEISGSWTYGHDSSDPVQTAVLYKGSISDNTLINTYNIAKVYRYDDLIIKYGCMLGKDGNYTYLLSIPQNEEKITIPAETTTINITITSNTVTEIEFETGSKLSSWYNSLACPNLEKVTLPASNFSSGGIFSNCYNLKTVILSEGMTNISSGLLRGSTSITSITIPNTVVSIGSSAFYGCTGLTSVNIPNSVTAINSYAFYNCSNLATVTFEGETPSLGTDVFYGTAFLNNLSASSTDGLCYIGTLLVSVDSSATGEITIKEGTTKISDSVFQNNKNITKVTLPESVVEIGCDAFSGCSSLTSISLCKVETIGENAFQGTGLTTLIIPDTVKTMGDAAFVQCSSLKDVTIGDGLTSITPAAFGYCTELENVTFGDNIVSIDQQAFTYCSKLSSLSIPNTVTTIGQKAFYYCSGLTEINIPTTVHTIEECAFQACLNVTSITISSGVTNIGSYAFAYLTKLETINWDNNSLTFDSSSQLFYYAGTEGDGITVNFGDNVEKVPNYIFYGSDIDVGEYIPIVSINLSDNVKEIGSYAFRYCVDLKALDTNKVEKIDKEAFGACYNYENETGLKTVTFRENLKEIGTWAFCNCLNISTLFVPDTVTTIGSYAFYGIDKVVYTGKATDSNDWYAGIVLRYVDGDFAYENSSKNALGAYFGSDSVVTIPECVEEISAYAFKGCSTVTSVIIPSTVETIYSNAFNGCSNLEAVNIAGNTRVYNTAFDNTKLIADDNGVLYAGTSVLYVSEDATGDIVLKEGTTTINAYAFLANSNITSITIPDSVTYVGECAFKECGSLSVITMNGTNIQIGAQAFDDTAYYNETSNWSNGILVIGTSIVEANSSINANLVISDGITSIADDTFYYHSVQSITLPSSLKVIGSRAFAYTAITSFSLPANVEYIGKQALAMCSSLASITVDSANATYDSRNNCNAIIEKATNKLIAGCSSTIIPESITSIGDYAFSCMTNLTSITIPNSVTEIGKGAFGGTGITTLTVPNTVTTIGEAAFYNINTVNYSGSASGSPWGAYSVVTE